MHTPKNDEKDFSSDAGFLGKQDADDPAVGSSSATIIRSRQAFLSPKVELFGLET